MVCWLSSFGPTSWAAPSHTKLLTEFSIARHVQYHGAIVVIIRAGTTERQLLAVVAKGFPELSPQALQIAQA